MSNSEPNTQTTAARRSAEADLSRLIANLAPAHQRLIAAVRKALRKRLPAAHEIVYEYSDWIVISYSPNEHGYEGVLAIRASADEVKLYFNHGKGLPDPEKLLRGSAKLVRWIPLESAATLSRPAVVKLVDDAIARNRISFESTGLGSLVIRSKAAK